MADDLEKVMRVTQSAGGLFRFGKGFMGKSTLVLVSLIAVGGIVAYRSPVLFGFLAFLILAILSCAWFCSVRRFTIDHPDIALLEGAEWSSFKMFEASSKDKPKGIEGPPVPDSPRTPDSES